MISKEHPTVQKRIKLPTELADRLRQLAEDQSISEDEVVEKALNILFSLAEIFDANKERQGWSLLSQESLTRVWDNDEDAIYDNWRRD